MNAMTIYLEQILHSRSVRKIVTTRWVPTVAAAIVDIHFRLMEEHVLVIQLYSIFMVSCIPRFPLFLFYVPLLAE